MFIKLATEVISHKQMNEEKQTREKKIQIGLIYDGRKQKKIKTGMGTEIKKLHNTKTLMNTDNRITADSKQGQIKSRT